MSGYSSSLTAIGAPGAVALAEVVAFQHACHRRARREADDVVHAHRLEPFGVAPDLDPVGQEDLLHLLHVRGGVGVDLLLRELRAGRRLAAGIAEPGGEVAQDEDGGVAELLELAELAQHDREAEVDVRCGRVDAELHPERRSAAEPSRAGRPR